jgi:hypothetical protein
MVPRGGLPQIKKIKVLRRSGTADFSKGSLGFLPALSHRSPIVGPSLNESDESTRAWGKSRAGENVVRQVTAKSRYARALAAVTEWCRSNRHQPSGTSTPI